MTDFKMSVVHLDAPGSGPTYPYQVTYSDTGGPAGQTPVAAIVVGTSVVSLDTHGGTARISYGFTDGTDQRCNAAVYEDGDSAANNAASSFADNGAVFVLGPNTGGGTAEATASFVSFGTNEITLEWSASSTSNVDIVLIYGDVSAKVVSFASSASIDGTESTTAPGFQPDLIFGITSGLAYSSGGSTTDGKISFGFAARDSETNASAALVWEHNQSRTSVGNINNDNGIVSVLDSTSGTVSKGTRLEVTTFGTTGFTVTTRDAAVSIEAAYLALDLHGLRAWVGAPLLPTGTSGSFSRTDPGFNPSVLLFSSARTGVINTVVNSQGNIAFGYAADSEQGGSSVFGRDNQTTADSKSHHSETYCGVQIQTAGGYNYRFSHTSFDATGWTGSVATAAAGDQYVPYVAVERPVSKIFGDTEAISDAFAKAVAWKIPKDEAESISDTFAISRKIALDEQETISDDFVSILAGLDLTEVHDETESISDTFAISRKIALDEQETISDDFVAILAGLDLTEIHEEAESISDTFAISRRIALDEQESILDTFVSVISFPLDFADTETISDDFVAVVQAGGMVVTDDQESISDDFVAALGTVFVSDESVGVQDVAAWRLLDNIEVDVSAVSISDDFVAVTGTVFVSDETVGIEDDFNTGRGLIIRKSIKRGCVFG